MHPISRRDFLRASGASALGLVAVACGGGNGNGGAARTLADVVDGRPRSLNVISAGFETFSGRPQRIVFGLQDGEGVPLQGATGSLWTAKDQQEEAIGPVPLTFRGEGLGERGVYVAETTYPTDGLWIVVIEAEADGRELVGAASIQIGQATQMPKPGDEAIAVATPTTADPRGVDPICTLEPPCSMHAASLDDALANTSQPTILIIATPRFCTSALCGPEVEILSEVSQEFSDRADFVHIELLKDASNETAQQWAASPNPSLFSPGAAAWRVEQEPVIYFIDPAGAIADRVIGPFDRAEARAKVEGLLQA